MIEAAVVILAVAMGVVALALSTTSLRRARKMQRKADEQSMALLDDLAALGELSRNVLLAQRSAHVPSKQSNQQDAADLAAARSNGKVFGPYSLDVDIRAWTTATSDATAVLMRVSSLRSNKARDAMLRDLLEEWIARDQAEIAGWSTLDLPSASVRTLGQAAHVSAHRRRAPRDTSTGSLLTA